MKKESINILVTSAGTSSAVSVIRALRQQNEVKVKIVAIDMDRLAAGLFLADKQYVVSQTGSKSYFTEIRKIIATEKIKVIFPIHSKEISFYAANKKLLKNMRVKFMLPNKVDVDSCNDKTEMDKLCKRKKILSPKLFTVEQIRAVGFDNFPVFAKPARDSSSSNGVFKANNLSDLNAKLYGLQNMLIQEFIEGVEITVDVFCDSNSKPIVIAPRVRIETKSGQTVKGMTVNEKRVINPIQKLCKLLNFTGPCNFQFIFNEKGAYFIELNPRYAAGGLMLTLGAGVNIPLIHLKLLLGLSIRNNNKVTKKGVYMSRYWDEIIINK